MPKLASFPMCFIFLHGFVILLALSNQIADGVGSRL
jgi:hypothetical protein